MCLCGILVRSLTASWGSLKRAEGCIEPPPPRCGQLGPRLLVSERPAQPAAVCRDQHADQHQVLRLRVWFLHTAVEDPGCLRLVLVDGLTQVQVFVSRTQESLV